MHVLSSATSTRRRRCARWAASVLLASGLAVAAPSSPVAADPGEQSTSTCMASGRSGHVVGSGDTWFDIAREAGVSVGSLTAANDVTSDHVLHPGDVVCLPSGARSASGCPISNAPTHTVRSGDTWWDIARDAGVSMRAVLDANGASDDRIIRPGQRVCLPVGASTGGVSSDGTSSGGGGATATTAAGQRSPGGLQALPMQGPCWFSDSWGAPRGDGRRHEGTDLFASTGSYIYAVVDGTLTRRAWDRPGLRSGNAWWLTAADGSGTYYFYAHLDDFAPGLSVGDRVEAGEIIGFMGNTGNSSFPHLHFEIHPNGASAVNPYQTLRNAGGCKGGSGYRQPSGWVPS